MTNPATETDSAFFASEKVVVNYSYETLAWQLSTKSKIQQLRWQQLYQRVAELKQNLVESAILASEKQCLQLANNFTDRGVFTKVPSMMSLHWDTAGNLLVLPQIANVAQ